MAIREWRFTLRRLGVYMTSITVGVAALVALHSFRDDVVRSIEAENLSLLGADARFSAGRPLPDSVLSIVDSLTVLGATVARSTNLLSMALAEESGLTRLVQLRGVDAGFPFYGDVTTDPPGLWGTLDAPSPDAPPPDSPAWLPPALADPALLAQLDAEPGGVLTLGTAQFRLTGTVDGLPTDVGFQTATGPRVFVARERLAATGLLTTGSLSRHYTYVRLPPGVDPDDVEDAHDETLRATGVSLRTPKEHARSLTRSADFLEDFLALVGLAALMLGGVGVGSAVSVYVRGRLGAVALLRCVGATRRQVFSTYLLQAAVMGFLGSALGVAAGLVVQRFLPRLIRDVLPVDVTPAVSLGSASFGLVLGVWVAVVFALLPLLGVRKVSPLQALRHVAEPPRGRDPARWAAVGATGATVLALTLLEAPSPQAGLAFAMGLGVVACTLWLVAWGLAWAVRRFFPKRAGYTLRQGVANLFRPGNQTVAVTLALGFGVLVVGVIVQLQRTLARELSLDAGPNAFNLLVFDVQPDQEDGVSARLTEWTNDEPEPVPVVTMRLASIKGATVGSLLADSARDARPPRWVLRQEHRATYRADLRENEEVLAGRWWDDGDAPSGGVPRASLEEDFAEDLGVQVGDTVTWMVGGAEQPSVVASLRAVEWAGFDANFLVVFEPGAAVEALPRTSVMLAHVPRQDDRAAFQRAMVRGFPNVSVLDLFTVRSTVEAILSRVLAAIRILAGLCTVAGLVVMAGSMASTRAQRRLEGALLRTLGARFGQVRRILLVEYAALGTLAALAGGVLSLGASWLLATRLFGVAYQPAGGAAVLLWLAVVALAVGAGVASGRGAAARAGPLPVLRAAAD